MQIKFVTLVCLLCAVVAAPEYYSVLGLQRGAGLHEVKRAFKKLAIKFHPDTAPEAQKEAFNKRFSEISDAYSVLTDEEKKNVYDRHGHQGLEELNKQKDWQNQNNARQEMHQSMVTDHFANTDLTILTTQSLPRFYRRSQVWLVLFYRSQDQEMRAGLRDVILELNTKFYGIFTVAAVNCDQDESICDEYRANNTPDIFVFTSDISHDGIRYTGDKAVPKMAGFAVTYMQSFVSIVTPANIDEFLGGSGKVKMLVFSDKKEPSPLMRALSKEFRTSIDIGHVKDDQNKISSRFGVARPPHILIVKNEGSETVHYGGAVNVNELSDFIREHRQLDAKGKRKQRVLHHVASEQDMARVGCGATSKSLCILIPVDSQLVREQVEQAMSPVIEQLGDDPTIIQTIDSSIINYSGLEIARDAKIIVIKPARKRIHVHESDRFDHTELMNILDKAVGGSLQFSAMKSVMLDVDEDL